MLNLYCIADDQPKPRNLNPFPLPYADSMEEETFENLQEKGIISERFDVYSTFRWGTDLIEQMQQTIQNKKLHHDADVRELLKLFNIAKENKSGLIAYGD
ncbi:hypothetical protein [Ohtaekwangia koreensis]|uniref:Uncharacterized protein n=1 Tax=Ohtaekwangia koreensis TaxID=688867 RepID=A0A1T5MF74_9BACT|nr:hypothetical protein [Ohtaekwangia koreensis]SKC86880.1 hypothetical protein SAMN05660236_5279 [Ohtaekwangia koreensis]